MRLLALLMAALWMAQPVLPATQATPRKQASKPTGPPQMVIDVNQASAEDFAKLPGVGPELARRIVAYREAHGPFRRVEDLLAIRGIGHKKWRALRPYLRVGSGAGKATTQGGEGRKANAPPCSLAGGGGRVLNCEEEQET